MIGMFAVSEVIRTPSAVGRPEEILQEQSIGNIFKGLAALLYRYKVNLLRGSVIGTAIGALPGAGADIAAWISYGVSRKFSKEPEKFGTGHVEGIVDAGASNNSALGGAWVPALVFGIPGDSITAIVIGVLYIKGMNPGPTVFTRTRTHLRGVHRVLPGQPHAAAARLGCHQVGAAAAARAARGADADHPDVLHRRHVRHQQHGVRRRRHAGARRLAYMMEENGFPDRAGDPRPGARAACCRRTS
jgi:hypothetical protein